MLSLRRATWSSAFLATFLCAGFANAADISGTVSTTLTILENSRLVGDVTCTVNGAPCLDIGAPNVTLDLNGFTVTGLGDPQSGCAGMNPSGTEHGIRFLRVYS